ncbi:MAG: L,D-transpeptidase family protein [Rhizobiales bacterium]|nr:L,D-transpeptidase family protein [Hyphomicrobiales bacterium]
MWSVRFDRLLTGTAVAMVLPLALALAASAQDGRTASTAEVEAGVPMPETPERPPLTIKDITPEPSPPTPANAAETNAPPATAAEAAVPAGADAGVTDKLRELVSGKFDRLIVSRKDRESINSFYQARSYVPLWIDGGAMNERGKAAISYLAGVAADGLDPADYPTPVIEAGADADALAEAEIRLTDAVLDFARHAQTGRVHYTRISADIAYNVVRREPADVLAKLAEANEVAAALDGFNPQQPGYKALKAALAKARTAPAEKPDVVYIAGGPILRPGMSDPRVTDLRKRLGVTADPDSPVYDDAVFQAVKDFQKDKGLGTDGMLGRNTLRAMNGRHRPSADPVDTIIANMERWRWLPRDLGKIYVMVNIPDFTLRVVRDNKLVWSTKIVVGKPSLATPIISEQMKFITVNPTWNVPPSIIRNEYLPALQDDPRALERIGLKLEQNRDGTIRVYQPPGDRNALGRIRFNFPNKFLVFQHDTPDKHLFARDSRAYSHGCIRVQEPLKYGEVLLSLARPGEGYTQERLRKMFGGSEVNINFPKPIVIHLTYQTAFVDDAGKLVLRSDIYGRDARITAALSGDQRRVADIRVDRPSVNHAAPVRMPVGTHGGGGYRYGGGGYQYGGGGYREPGFFERLFGLDPEPIPEPRRIQRRRSFGGGGRAFN